MLDNTIEYLRRIHAKPTTTQKEREYLRDAIDTIRTIDADNQRKIKRLRSVVEEDDTLKAIYDYQEYIYQQNDDIRRQRAEIERLTARLAQREAVE